MLTAEHLFFGYTPDHPVIRGVSLTFPSQTWTLLIGPNGSGKSTLLRLLDGYLVPQSGVVRWEDQEIGRIPARQRARLLGYLPQETASLFPFTVREILEMGTWARRPSPWALISRKDREAMAEVLQTLGLSHLEDRPITSLSGGERQLVFLARLWVQAPQFYLLDEPTRNLDMAHRNRLWRMLFHLKRQGKGGIVVTHELHFPQGFFDLVVALQNGQVLWKGPPSVVLKSDALAALYGTPMRVQDTPEWVILPQLGP